MKRVSLMSTTELKHCAEYLEDIPYVFEYIIYKKDLLLNSVMNIHQLCKHSSLLNKVITTPSPGL